MLQIYMYEKKLYGVLCLHPSTHVNGVLCIFIKHAHICLYKFMHAVYKIGVKRV